LKLKKATGPSGENAVSAKKPPVTAIVAAVLASLAARVRRAPAAMNPRRLPAKNAALAKASRLATAVLPAVSTNHAPHVKTVRAVLPHGLELARAPATAAHQAAASATALNAAVD
jgi:hypothetical protein